MVLPHLLGCVAVPATSSPLSDPVQVHRAVPERAGTVALSVFFGVDDRTISHRRRSVSWLVPLGAGESPA
ncbi:hypothetical protein Ae406Ps2_3356c [Pseudonocardia sp. Ae406_Ps2]|nr:hypothetical protein Ae331Ps2_2566 [Pseudonocardia sp. Ae331_Ps2]OLM03356.1 hypothetical protein Ae406Ps2_3356c [Pseudonocardia sp. Ae406_Ps2]OLM11749.1 hypothetical protein Ae505Ps2_1874 [Pseudonocardia sp. Ae505_Ps2]OLM24922.1 hypothetical protein Ae706Ps2_3355c [Pseudonocardia sp. Ae706_Ps2]